MQHHIHIRYFKWVTDKFDNFLGNEETLQKKIAKKIVEDKIEKVKSYLNSLKDDAETIMGGPYITFALDAKKEFSTMEEEHNRKLIEFEKNQVKKIKEAEKYCSDNKNYINPDLIDHI